MLKNSLAILFFVAVLNLLQGQNPLFIPDTLSGNNLTLNLKSGTKIFKDNVSTPTYGFNSNYMGPTLILNKGQRVSLTVNNQIGDTTTVHWHGLHVSAENDGGPHTKIMAGASWNPQFTVMDKAATYWYHPHLHHKTTEQVMRGAFGLILVRDDEENALSLPRTYGVDDLPLAVQTQQFSTDGKIFARDMQDSFPMVNGTLNAFVNVPAQVIRLRLLNGSQERNFNFGFSDNSNFYVIASDNGLLSAPVLRTRLRLAPGERAEILLNLTNRNGQNISLLSYASELPMGVQGGEPMNMPGMTPMPYNPLNGINFDVLAFNIGAPTTNGLKTIPSTLVTVTPLVAAQAVQSRTLTFTGQVLMQMDGVFYINNKIFDMERIDYRIPLNNTEIWTLNNQTMPAHPFHLHGNTFYILDRNGVAPPLHERGRKDVVLVLPNETVRIITKFEDFASATPFMFHCHILMHEDDGMMGQFVVTNTATGTHDHAELAATVRLFPNPTTGNDFTVEITDTQNPMISVFIYNTIGQLVHQKRFEQGTIKAGFDNLSLTNGNYMVKIETEKGFLTKKFAVVK